MIYRTIWVSIHSLKCFKTVWRGLFTSAHCSRLVASYHLDGNGRLLKSLRIPITVVYFKDQNWLSKTVNYISCLVVYKIAFCSKFPDIPDNAGKSTRRRWRRRRTQATAKRYAFHTNSIKETLYWIKDWSLIKYRIKVQAPKQIYVNDMIRRASSKDLHVSPQKIVTCSKSTIERVEKSYEIC